MKRVAVTYGSRKKPVSPPAQDQCIFTLDGNDNVFEFDDTSLNFMSRPKPTNSKSIRNKVDPHKTVSSSSLLFKKDYTVPLSFQHENSLNAQSTVKTIYELKAAGENSRFESDMSFILEGISMHSNISLAASSLSDLLLNCIQCNEYTLKVKANGYITSIFESVTNASNERMDILFALLLLTFANAGGAKGKCIEIWTHSDYLSYLYKLLIHKQQNPNICCGEELKAIEKIGLQFKSVNEILFVLLCKLANADVNLGVKEAQASTELVKFAISNLKNGKLESIEVLHFFYSRCSSLIDTDACILLELISSILLSVNEQKAQKYSLLKLLVNLSANQTVMSLLNNDQNIFKFIVDGFMKESENMIISIVDLFILYAAILINLTENDSTNRSSFKAHLLPRITSLIVANFTSNIDIEKCLIVSYLTLLLGCVCQDDEENVTTARIGLNEVTFGDLADLLENFGKMNLHTSTNIQESFIRIIAVLRSLEKSKTLPRT